MVQPSHNVTRIPAYEALAAEIKNLGREAVFGLMSDETDCIVVFGAALNQRTTSYGTSLPAGVPLIHVDANRSNIGRWFHADVALVADAGAAAAQLFEAVLERPAAGKHFYTAENRQRLADFDMASEFEAVHSPRTIDPRSVALELNRLLPLDRNAVFDAGNFLQVLPYIALLGPDHLKEHS